MTGSSQGFDFSTLSTAERVLIAQELLGSVLAGVREVAPGHVHDLKAEIRRRVTAVDSGQMAEGSWDDVKAELFPGL